MAAAPQRAPWTQGGAMFKPEPFSQAAAGTISLRPVPLPSYGVHADSSPFEGSSASALGHEQTGAARGTCRQLEPVVPGGYANQLLAPMAEAASIGVSGPTREPPAMQWARTRFQEPACLGTQPREGWQAAGTQQDAQAQARPTWGAVLRSRRPTQGLGRPSVALRPASSAPRADEWPQSYEPADGGRQLGAEAGGDPATAAVPGRHNSGGARGVAAMLAAMADAKERQADDMRVLAYFATAAASPAQQQEGEDPSGRASSPAPAVAARPQSNQPEVGFAPSRAAIHSSGTGSGVAAMLAAVAAAKERQARSRNTSTSRGYTEIHASYPSGREPRMFSARI